MGVVRVLSHHFGAFGVNGQPVVLVVTAGLGTGLEYVKMETPALAFIMKSTIVAIVTHVW